MTFLTGDVVVYHASIVTGGHGLLKKFGPMVIGCVLRSAKVVREAEKKLSSF